VFNFGSSILAAQVRQFTLNGSSVTLG